MFDLSILLTKIFQAIKASWISSLGYRLCHLLFHCVNFFHRYPRFTKFGVFMTAENCMCTSKTNFQTARSKAYNIMTQSYGYGQFYERNKHCTIAGWVPSIYRGSSTIREVFLVYMVQPTSCQEAIL